MNHPESLRRVLSSVSTYTGVKVTDLCAHTKIADLNLDSLDLISMVLGVEDAFGVNGYRDSIAQLRQLTTLGELADDMDRLVHQEPKVDTISLSVTPMIASRILDR